MLRGMEKLKAAVARRVRTWGALGAWTHRNLLGDGMGRERRAMRAGQAQYGRSSHLAAQAYRLRRATHMLEKGLTMRPRRSSFAADYIETAVADFCLLFAAPEEYALQERAWSLDVLREYFDATSESDVPAIVRARRTFLAHAAANAPHEGRSPSSPKTNADTVDIAKLEMLAKTRQSVRWFTSTEVPRDVVDRAIAVGVESPTACNRQPYRFYLYDDPALVERVASIPMGTAGYVRGLRAIAVLVGDMSAFADDRDRHLIYVDGCLAAMGFIYGLESQGVASCCINWPDLPDRDRAMARALGLQPWERVIMLIAYGYPDESGLAPYSQKKSLDAVRSYNVSAVSTPDSGIAE